MGFNTSSSKAVMSEINVTPLVDVMLVLLVVFIVTAPLLTPQALNVTLPKTEAVSKAPAKKHIQLVLTEQGQLVWEGEALNSSELVQRLQQLARDENASLEIVADENVKYGRVAQLMATAQANGVTRLSFLTNSSASKQ